MHGKGVVRRLSLKAAFLPVIDDLPAFVLLISKVRRPPLSPPVPFLSYCPLPPALSYLLHPPIELFSPPSHHSLTLMPSSPSLKPLQSSLPFSPPPPPPPPGPCFKFQVYIIIIILHGFIYNYQNFNIFGGPNWILLHAYIE